MTLMTSSAAPFISGSQSETVRLSAELRGNMSSSLLCCFLLFITVWPADGFESYTIVRCVFNSSGLEDIEFIRSLYYEKKEFLRFSSSVGHFVGYTELGVKNADRWNKGPEVVQDRAEKERYCLNHVENAYQSVLTKSVQPSVRIYSSSSSSSSSGHPSMLVCRVFDFYPKTIRVTWLRDGQEVSSDVTTTDEMEDGDWYYQVQSDLEYTPRSGEKISCKVEHMSLSQPLITDWDPSMPEAERNKIAIGASGLILGLVLSLAGFIYFKRKARGRILVPTN